MGPYCNATPLRPRPRLPVVPERVNLKQSTASSMADVYRGPGIAGCERGAVMRLGSHHYRYGGNGDTYTHRRWRLGCQAHPRDGPGQP